MNKLKYILALFITPVLLCADYAGYHTADSLNTKLTNYALTYPNICSLEPFGTSTNGKPIYGLKISDNPTVTENEPKIHISGSIHGNEPIGMEICVKLIDHLIQSYATDTTIQKQINNGEIFIFPLLNPDGLTNSTRANANGKDLNRDFPDGVVNDIGNFYENMSVNYFGAQQETKNIIDWHISNITTLNVNIHSGSVTVVYPYGNYPNAYGTKYTASPDDALYIDICQEYADLNSRITNNHSTTAPIINGAQWYPVTGEMPDWVYRYTGSLAITVEVSMTKAPSSTLINTHWLENKDSLLAMISRNSNALHGTVTDFTTDQPVKAKISLVNAEGENFYTNTLGQYNRILSPGNYQLKVEALGYHTSYKEITIIEGQPELLNISLNQDSLIVSVADAQTDQLLPADVTILNQANSGFSLFEPGHYSKNLTPGNYQLHITANGYQPQVQQVEIIENELLTKTIALNTNSFSLVNGWNLVAIPTNATASINSLIWTWDTATAKYIANESSSVSNTTFWIYSTTQEEITVHYDSLFPNSSITLGQGWNMVSPDTRVITSQNEIYDYLTPAYYYDDYYKTSTTLRPYQGYWIFSHSPQFIALP